MNVLRLFLILVLAMIGLINRRHFKHSEKPPVQIRMAQNRTVQARPAPTAVDKELLQNAERLAETLRRCQETAHHNRVTQ